jgi:hypothetical protein
MRDRAAFLLHMVFTTEDKDVICGEAIMTMGSFAETMI